MVFLLSTLEYGYWKLSQRYHEYFDSMDARVDAMDSRFDSTYSGHIEERRASFLLENRNGFLTKVCLRVGLGGHGK